MGRDMAKKNANDAKWKKENTVQYGVRIMNSTGIPAAMDLMIDDIGKTRNAYIIEAIREKLIRDGYMQGGSEPK